MTATGAAAVTTAPVAIPPPTTEPMDAIPDDIAAAPAVPDVPAKDAKVAPVVPAVADMMVAAEPPATADAVLAAVPTAPAAPSEPATVEPLMLLDIWISS